MKARSAVDCLVRAIERAESMVSGDILISPAKMHNDILKMELYAIVNGEKTVLDRIIVE